jgi:hypothetical protein
MSLSLACCTSCWLSIRWYEARLHGTGCTTEQTDNDVGVLCAFVF